MGLALLRLDVIDGVLHLLDLLGVVIGDFDVEFLFHGHDELGEIEGVGSEVVHELGFGLHFIGAHAKLVHDDLDAMNHEFGLDYWSNRINAWEDFPDVRGTINGRLGAEFEKYQRSLVDEFLGWQADIVSEYKRPKQFVTHNFDFAQIEELYALSDSSTNPPKDAVFSSSYKVVKGKYLWSCVKVTYNNSNISYLNKKCVSYFPNDGVNGTNGTSFNLLGTAAGHMKTWVKPSPFLWNTIYLVDGVNGGYPMTYKITTEGVKSAKANVGDAYIIDGNLWVANTTEWVNVGNIQGAPGEPGQDGEDALNIELSTDKILFDYYEGNFDPQNKSITLVVRQGGNVIKSSEYNVKIVSAQNFDIRTGNKLTIEKQDSSCTLNCYANGVATYSYTYDDGASFVSYPASSCSIKISVEYNGITYFKEISIEVSLSKTISTGK